MGAPGNDEFRPLSILGISEDEERVYRWLLAHPRASMLEVARSLRLSSSRAQRLLDAIEAKGLSTRTPERPRKYVPVSPDVAIESLAVQKNQAVRRAQDMIPELQKDSTVQRSDEQDQMVELITNVELERQIYEQMDHIVENEFVTLARMPMRVSRLDIALEQNHRSQQQARVRGVRYRSVVDSDLMRVPGFPERIRSDMQAGEEIRIMPALPIKLVLADRRLALIPLNLERTDSPVLLVRFSPLLDAFYALFEMFWERAVPLPSSGAFISRDEASDQEPFTTHALELITLLASGLNDKNIAGELNISSATLNRRIVAMMKNLGVRTRFQAGWQARGIHSKDQSKTSEE